MLKEYLKNEIGSLAKEVSVTSEGYHHSSLSRLNCELYYAEYFQIEEEILALHKLSTYLKANNIPYYFRGNSSNLYLLYLLGISRINPLDFNLSYENFYGLELEISKLHSSQLYITMTVPNECYSAILEKLKCEPILQNKKIDTRTGTFSIGKISLTHWDMPCEMKGYHSKINYNDLLKFMLEVYHDDAFDTAIDTLFDCKNDISLTDVIKIFGLIHGTWTFDDILTAFKELDMPLSDVPACYDDVFDMLLPNFTNKEAWKYADSVHWGHGLPQQVAEHLSPAILNWCNSALYLFPKVHALEYMIHKYKLNVQ